MHCIHIGRSCEKSFASLTAFKRHAARNGAFLYLALVFWDKKIDLPVLLNQTANIPLQTIVILVLVNHTGNIPIQIIDIPFSFKSNCKYPTTNSIRIACIAAR